MFGSVILDVTIGLVLIYFLYALLATTINEIIASVLNLRGKKLKLAIERMLVDDNSESTNLSKKLFEKFYSQPLIKHMSANSKRDLSFMTPGTFAIALFGSLKECGAIKENFSPAALSATLAKLNQQEGKSSMPSDTIRLLESFLSDANYDIEKFQERLKMWFIETMDRATGWYKRQTQWIIFCIGLVIAIGFNVDTLEIVKTLSQDKNAREQMVALAKSYLDANPALSHSDSSAVDSLLIEVKKQVSGEIKRTNAILGLGWGSCNLGETLGNPLAWIGWLLTMFAISLGAPFWFDLLSKFMNIRGTGTKPIEQIPAAITQIPINDCKG